MKGDSRMKDEKVYLTQEATEIAGYPCSDSAGEDMPDVAEVEVLSDGEQR